MKATELVKKFGWEESKALVNAQSWTMRQIALSTTVDTKELTRLVESHELVMDYYGLTRAKEHAESNYTAPELKAALKQAITDVEACKEVS